jgi:hypothetical protein
MLNVILRLTTFSRMTLNMTNKNATVSITTLYMRPGISNFSNMALSMTI